jgi:XRE family aerobic/anaerobic benzoate catabolism transcriptional regulator
MGFPDEKNLLLAGIGAQVRALRTDAKLTVKDFAQRADLSPRFVIQLEGGRGNISIAGLARVAAALGRPLHDLIPPTYSDYSSRAQLWRLLSRCSDNDLQEFQQWIAHRVGEPAPQFIALVGLRGAGKSTVGPMLAARLKVDFIELDALIEEAATMSLSEIFAIHGEEYYRRLEREILAKVLGDTRGCVLAAGGSIVTDPESWGMVKRRCTTVWLQATPEELMKRLQRQGDLRPMQGRPSAMAELKALVTRREPLYGQAEMVTKTTNKSPAAVMDQIIKAVSRSRTAPLPFVGQ